jgi:hypothetical protein
MRRLSQAGKWNGAPEDFTMSEEPGKWARNSTAITMADGLFYCQSTISWSSGRRGRRTGSPAA